MTRSPPAHGAVARAGRRAGGGSRLARTAGRGSASACSSAGPVGWLVVAYLGSLLILFLNAFWSRDAFTGLVIREFTLDNFVELVDEPGLPDGHAAHGRHGGGRHRDVRRPRLPDRVLHGPRRVAARPRRCSSSRS